MTRFQELEETETRRFLHRIFQNPDNFMDYIRALALWTAIMNELMI